MNFKEEQENGKFRLIAIFSDFEQKILKNDLLGLDGIVTWVDNNVKQKFSVLSIKTVEEDGNLKIEWSISPADKIDAELKSIEEITKNKLENCKVRMFSAWGRDIWERYKKNFDKDDEEYVALITSQKDYKDREAREEELNNQSKKYMECIQEIQRNFPAQSAFEDNHNSSFCLDEQLVLEIQRFEDLIKEAWVQKQKEHGQPGLYSQTYLARIHIQNFYELLVTKGSYSRCTHSKLISLLFEIKIQLFFILEVEMGRYNQIYNGISSLSDLKNNPLLSLRKLSVDQNLIVKNRILWERIMNFVYYLEKGEELTDNSKISKFFKLIEGTKWKFLKLYRPRIESLNKWRTAEVHQGSILKRLFVMGQVADDYEINEIINVISNVFWSNLLLIIQGKNPTVSYLSTPGYR